MNVFRSEEHLTTVLGLSACVSSHMTDPSDSHVDVKTAGSSGKVLSAGAPRLGPVAIRRALLPQADCELAMAKTVQKHCLMWPTEAGNQKLRANGHGVII